MSRFLDLINGKDSSVVATPIVTTPVVTTPAAAAPKKVESNVVKPVVPVKNEK